MKIEYPYMNDYCEKCENHYFISADEARCKVINLGMSDAMCAQIKECSKFKEKQKKKKMVKVEDYLKRNHDNMVEGINNKFVVKNGSR